MITVAAVRKARTEETVHAPPRGVGSLIKASFSFNECAEANESIDLRGACMQDKTVKSSTMTLKLAPTIMAASGGIEINENGPGVSVTRTRGRRAAVLQIGAATAARLKNGDITSDALAGSGCERKPGQDAEGGHGLQAGAKPKVPEGQPAQPVDVKVR